MLLLIANIFHHLNKHQQQEQRGRRKELTSGTKRSWRDDKKNLINFFIPRVLVILIMFLQKRLKAIMEVPCGKIYNNFYEI